MAKACLLRLFLLALDHHTEKYCQNAEQDQVLTISMHFHLFNEKENEVFELLLLLSGIDSLILKG